MLMQRGFTILELIVVITITLVLIGITTAVAWRAVSVQEIDRARELVRSELTTAQNDALAGTRDATWGVAFSGNTLTRFQGASFATRNPAYDRVTIFSAAISITGAPEIVFARTEGIPASPATLTITDGIRSAMVVVSTAGAIDVQ